MESFYFVILMTFVGFTALAAALLVPVYLFLKKEEKAASLWTKEQLGQDAAGDTGLKVGAASSAARTSEDGSVRSDQRLSER